jgi:predicted acylesterase/phospholipase RssA
VPNIETLKLPFATVATDLNRGTCVVIDKESVAEAARASSAVSSVFFPVDCRWVSVSGIISPSRWLGKKGLTS